MRFAICVFLALLFATLTIALTGCLQERPVGDRITVTDFAVLRVIDGDTFVVKYDGEPTRVRLLAPVSDAPPPPPPVPGFDAPEPRESGGAEAAAELRARLTGRRVRLSFPAPTRRDAFGRLLSTAALLPPS